jgi:hypothetical protein
MAATVLEAGTVTGSQSPQYDLYPLGPKVRPEYLEARETTSIAK